MSFSAPIYIGNAFGPGKAVVTCLTVVIDEVSDQQLHETWHAHTDPDAAPRESTPVAEPSHHG